jgi:4-hydroxy-tetrahydrodipicolinate synthase
MKQKFTGLYVPMITPFKPGDESIYEEGIRNHVEFLIENGVDGLIPCGSSGEFVSMETYEQNLVNEIVCDAAKGRVKVFCGTAAYSTKKTIELSKHAEACGADGVMVVTPWYLTPNEDELYAHYAALRNAISIPIMLYHNPYYTNVLLTDEFMAKLYNDGIVQAIKERQADVFRIQKLRYLTDEGFSIFYGYDISEIEAIVMGADGWVSGIGNLFPAENKRIITLMNEGRQKEAIEWHMTKIMPYLELFMSPTAKGYGTPWMAILKEGLAMRGVDAGVPRKPLLGLEKAEKEKLHNLLAGYGYLKN